MFQFQIRNSKEEELDQIAVLWGTLMKELEPKAVPDVEFYMKSRAALMKQPHWLMLSAVLPEDGEVIGFVEGLVYYDAVFSKNIGSVSCVYVLPEYRKTLVSKALYKTLYQIADQAGVTTVEIVCSESEQFKWKKKGFNHPRVVLRRE